MRTSHPFKKLFVICDVLFKLHGEGGQRFQRIRQEGPDGIQFMLNLILIGDADLCHGVEEARRAARSRKIETKSLWSQQIHWKIRGLSVSMERHKRTNDDWK
jgi:hypothetical protein